MPLGSGKELAPAQQLDGSALALRRRAAQKLASQEEARGIADVTKTVGGILGAIIGTIYGDEAGGKIGFAAGSDIGEAGGLAFGGDTDAAKAKVKRVATPSKENVGNAIRSASSSGAFAGEGAKAGLEVVK